jgi:hypothetical protein
MSTNTPTTPQTVNFVPPPLLTPSLDPRVFDGDTDDLAIQGVKNAMAVGLEAATRAYQGAVAIHLDETLSTGGRHVKADQWAVQVTRPALMKFDSEGARLAATIAGLEAKLRGPAPPAAVVAAEVRAAFRALTPKEKGKATHAAIEQGDDGSIGALLDGPLMLTGMSATERDLLSARWAKERLPVEVKRLEELKKASVHLRRAGSVLLSYSLTMADASVVARAKRSAEAAAKAMAGAA